MAIQINEKDLVDRLAKLGDYFSEVLEAKDKEITESKEREARIRGMYDSLDSENKKLSKINKSLKDSLEAGKSKANSASNDEVLQLRGRLEKAKGFFLQQKEEIKQLKASQGGDTSAKDKEIADLKEQIRALRDEMPF